MEIVTQIGVAGNTAAPALYALRHKGYAVTLSHLRDGRGDHSCSYTATSYTATSYTATGQGRRFVGGSPEEVLGLVAMWEVRGDDWRAHTDEERAWHDALVEAARVYDADGNDVTDED